MGEFPSGQRGQTVNLLSVTSVVRIHPLPPKQKPTNRSVFCFVWERCAKRTTAWFAKESKSRDRLFVFRLSSSADFSRTVRYSRKIKQRRISTLVNTRLYRATQSSRFFVLIEGGKQEHRVVRRSSQKGALTFLCYEFRARTRCRVPPAVVDIFRAQNIHPSQHKALSRVCLFSFGRRGW